MIFDWVFVRRASNFAVIFPIVKINGPSVCLGEVG